MTLFDIETDLNEQLSYPPVPAPSVRDRLRRYINQTHRQILSIRGLSKLRRAILTTSSVAESPFLSLPQAAVHIHALVDRTTSVPLSDITLTDIRVRDPGLMHRSANPGAYTILNFTAAVARDPTVPSTVSVKSTAVTDGATKAVYLEGVRSGGYLARQTIVLNGTTPVTDPGIADWVAFTRFQTGLAAGGAANASGNITLHQGAGGVPANELAFIASNRSNAVYTRLHLFPVPMATVLYHVDVDLMVLDLASPSDSPLLPEDFHWLLISGALIKEHVKRQHHDAATEERRNFKDGLGDLLAFVSRATGPAINTERRRGQYSQLGPWFPAGS